MKYNSYIFQLKMYNWQWMMKSFQDLFSYYVVLFCNILWYKNLLFYIIKSVSEDEVNKPIKLSVRLMTFY